MRPFYQLKARRNVTILFCATLDGVSSEQTPVQLRLLGGFALKGPDGCSKGGNRPLDVEMAYLMALLPNEPMTNRDLGAALWPGMIPELYVHRLPRLRAKLRQRLGVECLRGNCRGWYLDPDQVTCDLWDLLEQPRGSLMFGPLAAPESIGPGQFRFEQARRLVLQARKSYLLSEQIALRGQGT